MTHNIASQTRRDDGGIAVFTAVCVLALLAIIGLVLDGGGKLRATERADALATEAARVGGQALAPGAAVTGAAIRVDPQAPRPPPSNTSTAPASAARSA